MKIFTVRRGAEIVLFVVPGPQDKLCRVQDFASIGEPLVAVIKHDRGYKLPHLEVRKKNP